MPDENQIKYILEESFPEAEISVSLDGGHLNVSIVSLDFIGLRQVTRQQRVYAPLAQLIAEGKIHAVNIKALTPDTND